MAPIYTGMVTSANDGVIYDSQVTFYRQNGNNGAERIGVMNDHYLSLDIRRTKIAYSGGSLHFCDLYHTPLINHRHPNFTDENQNTIATLHTLLIQKATCIEHDNRFYQVTYDVNLSTQRWCYTVYDHTPIYANGMLCYPKLATVSWKGGNAGAWMYECQLDHAIPTQLLMVILSLPFTFPA